MSARILIVEDEPAIRELVAVNLRHAGYSVSEAATAEDARTQLDDAAPPDLVLLDWMLPRQSGLDFAKQLRDDPRTAALPIVLLTARALEGDKLQGFEVGADDYVTKPFSPRELVARVRALLRRRAAPGASGDEPIEIAGLRLEPASMRVSADGAPLALSPTEFRLLHCFMRNADRVLSRARLLDDVWGDHVYIEERTVDVHIRRLRLALGGHQRLIETVRGGGTASCPAEIPVTPLNLLLRSLAAIALVVVIALVLDLYVSQTAAVWWLGTAFVVHAVVQSAYLVRLHHWASLPRNRSLPAGIGPWRPIVARLARFVRQETDTRNELDSELGRIHAAVDRLPDGLVVLDRYDHVLWANDAAEALHGIFGTRRPIHHFIRQPEFTRLLQANEPGSALRVQLPDHPGRIHELRLHPSQGDQKLLITRDVTDQAKLDAMRSDFVANVSHEIRTPITVIAGFAETLLELELDEAARREYLGSILKQSQTMQRLVDDLLMLSSLESGSNGLEDEPVELRRLLEALLDEARTLSRERHRIGLDYDGPQRVLAAPGELESAVRNLLTNAIRYTPDGGRISLAWRVQDSEGRISVRDTGIGIPAEHMPRIAERFYRVDRGRSRATGGTGLGLAIVKHVMHRHQGRLEFFSTPGKGSVFSLCLPVARLLPDPVPSSAQAEPAISGGDAQAGPQAAAHDPHDEDTPPLPAGVA